MLAKLASVLLPPACAACGAALGAIVPTLDDAPSILCRECRSILRPLPGDRRCDHCGAAPAEFVAGKTRPGHCIDCNDLPDSFERAFSVFPYRGPAGFIVRNLKYRRSPYLASWLTHLALPAVRPALEELGPGTVVVPMPMYPWREMRRGYNQAELVARAVAEALGLALVEEGTLRRTVKGKPQARFDSREERARNLEGVYSLKRPELIRNKRLLLVDDVMTTGATVSAAAGSLLEGGASDIYAFTPVRARLGEDRAESV